MFTTVSAISSSLSQTGMLDRLNHCKSQKGQLTLNCQQGFHWIQTAEICSLFHQIFSKANLLKALPAALPFILVFFLLMGICLSKLCQFGGFLLHFLIGHLRKKFTCGQNVSFLIMFNACKMAKKTKRVLLHIKFCTSVLSKHYWNLNGKWRFNKRIIKLFI